MKATPVLLTLFILSCSNITSGEKQFAAQFDSINRVLRQTETQVSQESDSIYASLVNRIAYDSGEIRQFYYHIHDFYGYLASLRTQFYRLSGDSSATRFQPGQEDNKELTRQFFDSEERISRLLYTSLRFTFEKLRHQAPDDQTREAIIRFEDASLGNMVSMEDFKEVYLENTPPGTVITILNSFEQRIRRFELLVLTKYFNNYIHELKEKILWDGNSNRDTLSP